VKEGENLLILGGLKHLFLIFLTNIGNEGRVLKWGRRRFKTEISDCFFMNCEAFSLQLKVVGDSFIKVRLVLGTLGRLRLGLFHKSIEIIKTRKKRLILRSTEINSTSSEAKNLSF
jgi:hypothetical protein